MLGKIREEIARAAPTERLNTQRKIIREFHKTSAIERKNIVAHFCPLNSTGYISCASFAIPRARKILIVHLKSKSQCE